MRVLQEVLEVKHVGDSLREYGEEGHSHQEQEGHQGEALLDKKHTKVHPQKREVDLLYPNESLDKNHRSKIERLEVIFVKDESNKSPTN